MTREDAKGFALEMLRLEAVFGRGTAEDAELRAEAYFEALAAFSVDEIHEAVRLAVQRATWFPKPAELIAFIGAQRETRRQLAGVEQRALIAAQAATPEEAKGFLRQLAEMVTKRLGISTTVPPPHPWTEEEIATLHHKNAAAKAADPAHQARVEQARRQLGEIARG